MTLNAYSGEIYKNILFVEKLINDTNKNKYNLLLSFINDLLKQNSKYVKITQFKHINILLLQQTTDNLQLINDYINKFINNGLKLNINNKNPIYIIKFVSNKLGYSFIKKEINDNIYCSIIYK